MIYPRPFAHIAITALYLLLTLGVLGLIITLCTLNDTEYTYLFKSGTSRAEEKQSPSSANLKYMADQEQAIRWKYEITTPSLSKNHKLLNHNLKMESSDEAEQQHIYIDELNTEATKPKSVYDSYNNYRTMKITDGTKRIRNQSSLSWSLNFNYNGSESVRKQKMKKFRKLHVDDDTDTDNDNDNADENEHKPFYQELSAINNDNEIVASGSGDRSQSIDIFNLNSNENQYQNNHFDLETRRFIKRIGLRLSQLSKKNTSEHSYSNNIKSLVKSEPKRNQKLFRPGYIESKVNYYGSSEITTLSPIPSLKLRNISNRSEESGAFPFWTATQIKTRRVIGNERKSAERSRQLLLCEKGKSGGGGGGGELCRMLFKET